MKPSEDFPAVSFHKSLSKDGHKGASGPAAVGAAGRLDLWSSASEILLPRGHPTCLEMVLIVASQREVLLASNG